MLSLCTCLIMKMDILVKTLRETNHLKADYPLLSGDYSGFEEYDTSLDRLVLNHA